MQNDVNEILNEIFLIKKDIEKVNREIETLLISLGSDIIHQKDVENIEEKKKKIDDLNLNIQINKEDIKILKQKALDIIERECELNE